MGETDLIGMIAKRDWVDIQGMVPTEAPETLLDVVFHTAHGSVRITGKDHILQSGEEAFSLAVFEHVKAGWWAEKESDWTPINLKERWASMSLWRLMTCPRSVQFYSDPRFKERSFPMDALLDNCSAIEFQKELEGADKRLVLKASNDSPCAIEVGIGGEACGRLLHGLKVTTIRLMGKTLSYCP